MSTKLLSLLNFVITLATIAFNGVAGGRGLNGNTMAGLSEAYANLFTPAGYAFSIWGVIFLGLFVHAIHQLVCAFSSRDDRFIRQMGPWMIVANIANMLWLILWLYEYTGWSVLVMLVILVSLLILTIKLDLERWDAPRGVIAFIWWPICAYFGWISVATIANVAAYLAKIQWSTGGVSEVVWAIGMIVVTVGLNAFMIATRNMREFAAVGIWALVAIAVRHWGQIPELQWTATVGAGILLGYVLVHGYQRRKTNPFTELILSSSK